MKATYGQALDAAYGEYCGGKYNLTICFDDEPVSMILEKAKECLCYIDAFREREAGSRIE